MGGEREADTRGKREAGERARGRPGQGQREAGLAGSRGRSGR